MNDSTQRLASLLARFEKGPKHATHDDLRALPILYRSTISELAEARARGIAGERIAALESLIVQAHSILYVPAPVGIGHALRDLMLSFPASVRHHRRLIGLSALLLFVGTVWGYCEVRRDPSSAAVLLPSALQENADAFHDEENQREGDPIYGALYFTNNTRVALHAYALGVTFGVGTAIVLLLNGVFLGATFRLVEISGSPTMFLSFVAPHSGIELAAIVIAAAGGLRIGQGLLAPGWRRRRDSLTEAARSSIPLAMGSAVLLAIAGLIEGWISPQPWPFMFKLMIGGTVDVLLVAYLFADHSRVAGTPHTH